MLKKRGSIYWCDFYADGKRIRRSLKTSEHLLALKKLEALKSKYKKDSPGSIDIDEFQKKYIDYAWAEKPASAQREEQRLNKIIDFLKSEYNLTQLNEVTSYHIEQLKIYLKEKGLKKSTINRYMQIIRGMFYKASAWGIYEGKNPVRGVRFYKERSPVEPLTDDQIKQILEAAEKISRYPKSPLQRDFYDLCLIAVNTGMRKSEILNMKWSDIKNEAIHVIGKGDKDRTIPLNKAVLDILDLKARRYKHVFDIPDRKSSHVFRRSVERVRSETGITWNFHQLRHYFATKLLEKGTDIVTISHLLGHSKYTTSLIYSHTNMGRMKEAVDKLGDL